MKPLIYAVEDDAAIQELYTLSLESEFECLCFDAFDALTDALAGRIPDLIILDIMLPGTNGFEILSRLKGDSATANVPVIMVSAKGEEISKVKGLNMGADDYIAKPFGVMELIARIKANLRKHTPPHGKSAYKNIVVDDAKREITVNGNILCTTRKEYNLLRLLCENAGEVQEREVIFSKVWSETFIGESRTLDIHIKELRKKLADAGSEAVIKTVRGIGYMLT